MKEGDTIIIEIYDYIVCKKRTITTKVINIITDPQKKHEDKAVVELHGEKYGIPFSEIKTK